MININWPLPFGLFLTIKGNVNELMNLATINRLLQAVVIMCSISFLAIPYILWTIYVPVMDYFCNGSNIPPHIINPSFMFWIIYTMVYILKWF